MDNKNRINTLSSMFKICKFVIKIDSSILFSIVPKIIFQSVQPFIYIVFTSLIINAVAAGNRRFMALVYTASMLILSFLVSSSLSYLNNRLDISFDLTQKKISKLIGQMAMEMDYSVLEENSVRNLLNLAKDSNRIVEVFNSFSIIISSIITLIGLISIIIYVNIFILILVMLVVIVRILKDNKNIKIFDRWRYIIGPMLRKREYLNLISMQNIKFGKEIRLFQIAEWLNKKYEDNSKEIDQCATERNVEFQKQNALPELLDIIQSLIIYLYLGYSVVFSNRSIGYFMLILNSVLSFSSNLATVVSTITNLSIYDIFMKDFSKLIDLKMNSFTQDKGKIKLDSSLNKITIEFVNVSFKYPHTDKFVLKNISFKISTPQKIAIVGTNGSGKTTLIKLLLRFYQPNEGKIYINNVDISTIDYTYYTSLISAVFQDYRLFAFSIKENIALDDLCEEQKIMSSLTKSGLNNKIQMLNNNIDTIVSRDFDESGIEFSGGESQKLAIARAIYKESPIVILDEPTSALDAIAESDIYKRMSEFSENQLAIYVSHRLTSTQFCDQILVLSDGEIVESGNHKNLCDLHGYYANMFDKQAFYYKDNIIEMEK